MTSRLSHAHLGSYEHRTVASIVHVDLSPDYLQPQTIFIYGRQSGGHD